MTTRNGSPLLGAGRRLRRWNFIRAIFALAAVAIMASLPYLPAGAETRPVILVAMRIITAIGLTMVAAGCLQLSHIRTRQYAELAQQWVEAEQQAGAHESAEAYKAGQAVARQMTADKVAAQAGKHRQHIMGLEHQAAEAAALAEQMCRAAYRSGERHATATLQPQIDRLKETRERLGKTILILTKLIEDSEEAARTGIRQMPQITLEHLQEETP